MSTGQARRLSISHAGFCIAFCVTLYVACNALNIGRLARWFQTRDGIDYLGLAAYLTAGLCLFLAFFTLLAHRRTVKPLAILLTVASGAATYFISKYDVAIDSSMLQNALHTDSTEVGQLLSAQMIPYALAMIALPLLVIVPVEITYPSSRSYLRGSLKVVGIATALALACLYSNFSAIHRAGNVSNKYIVYSLVPVNVLSSSIAVTSKALKPWLAPRHRSRDVPATVAAPGNLVVVLAIGESSRRKNFSIYGYDRRNTTPLLGRIGGLQLLNGVARRGSTLYALPEILEKNEVKLPALVAKAGIPTACYVNYTLYDNCEGVGETKVEHCGHGGKCYDEDVLPLLEANLAAHPSGYDFVVLHLGGGSHGPIYRDRHPPEFVRFTPTCDDADVANRCTPEQLYNSYDNTVLYVDRVVSDIVHTLDHSGLPYVFMYLSDHGESLLEGGALFHGVPPGVALPPEQAQIPLIVKSSVPVRIPQRAEYRQQDVFDTVLDLFTIRAPDFDTAGSFVKRSGG